MLLERLRELSAEWRDNRDLEKAVNSAMDAIGFSEAYVGKVSSKAFEEQLPRKSKQIKDNVWGMIDFDWRSLRLIDSPVLQRLRQVKQLGLTYLTYPNAEHSRFSHSLGVGHVTGKFIEAIDKRSVEEGRPPQEGGLRYVSIESIPGISAQEIIHAALLHDIGHLPYSHVSEKVISTYHALFTFGGTKLSTIQLQVGRHLKKNLPLAEILSLFIVLSKRFEEFYLGYVRTGDAAGRDSLLNIGCLIAGIPPSDTMSGLTELISSASVDADKIDYVNRDARNCGVPVGVDVSRVFLRSGLVLASREQIKRIGLKEEPGGDEYQFVLNASGLDTIDEVLLARTALFQRVYFHAVTRAAEATYGRAVISQVKSVPDHPLSDVLVHWALGDSTILDQLLRSDNPETAGYARQIMNRDLPKKAYSFGPSLENMQFPLLDVLPTVTEGSLTEVRKLANTLVETYLRDTTLLGEGASELVREIAEELKLIVQALQASGQELQVPTAEPDTGLLAVGTAFEKKRRHVQVLCQGDQLIAGRKYTNAPEQQDAFELLKEVGFILCKEAWRALVFFATRATLARWRTEHRKVELLFGLGGSSPSPEEVTYITRFLPEYGVSALRSGLPAKRLRTAERALRQARYFDRRPWVAEPISPDENTVQKIGSRLSLFQGYHGWRVTPRSVASFVSQFPPYLREKMLDVLLEELVVIDSQNSVKRLLPLLESLTGQISIVPLSPTSGSQISTWLEKETYGARGSLHFFKDVAAAVGETGLNGPIIFVDDNASSGIQATAQLLNLFDVPRVQWPLNSQTEDNLFSSLPAKSAELLRERPIHVFVCVGDDRASARISDGLKKAGVECVFEGLRCGEQIEASDRLDPDLAAYLTTVGTELGARARFGKAISDCSEDEVQECKDNAMGYGNKGGLVTTLLSVPTATVTALWQPGVFSGQPWIPLLLRSSKLKHLVLG